MPSLLRITLDPLGLDPGIHPRVVPIDSTSVCHFLDPPPSQSGWSYPLMALRIKPKNSMELPSCLSPSLLLKSSVLQWLPCSEFIHSHNLKLHGVPWRHPWPFISAYLNTCFFLAEVVSSTTSPHPLCPSHPNSDITSSMKPFLNQVSLSCYHRTWFHC